jgi:chromate reductase, NAD(P)H dehydrogenase (quinone)
MPSTILVFSGSWRPGSLNMRLATLAAGKLSAAGAQVTHISLADYPLPLVDATGYKSHPPEAKRLQELIAGHQGLFIASPEYNAGYAPALKNALDWASVTIPTPVLAGKVVALGAASAGAMGGYRSLTQFRTMLELGMGALVIPNMVAVGGGEGGWSPDGSIRDERSAKMLDALVERLVGELARRAPETAPPERPSHFSKKPLRQ